ncbi:MULTISPECIES: depupylase/deamidase Dop [Arthrobacter]|uniref:Depupylase/deamidase Dop n=2 Tax=Arthrobacter TaxID=1663 RepID=A0ABU9KK50_9MICC|nr:depupylase/deamidase Dop [Arthrobacter sp. YJM1]MDP5225944.1 depupylase/deamidase Dop [Arthrobacter sp. YJM1]
MGSETEYGIHAPLTPTANATVLSARVIEAYARLNSSRLAGEAGARRATAGWDYSDEEPLHDARGWTMPRNRAHYSQLTDVEPVLDATAVALAHGRAELDYSDVESAEQPLMNMVLGNGARFYVDHAHPEYSSPEVTGPRDAVIWDAAGDLVALESVRALQEADGTGPVNLYKNNTDNKAVSYGSHENYLMPREVPFSSIAEGLIPFFVSRQVLCGSGRLGLGQDGRGVGYQISQRADFFEAEVGLETTIRRPIINTRDEPHATADKYRRLHVIIGDANLSQYANYLKFGTASLVLGLIEAGRVPKLQVFEPVAALQDVSHDTSLQHRVRLIDGRRLTAVELQWLYFEAAKSFAEETGAGHPSQGDGETHALLTAWEETLGWLESGDERAAQRVEWLAKLRLLEGYRDRGGLAWNDAKLGLIDLQWSDIRPEKGLYHRLAQHGRMEKLVDDAEIAAAVTAPPEGTRAFFRGMCLSRFPREVTGASWDSVIFRLPRQSRSTRIPTREPLRGTRELTGALFDAHQDAEDFLRALQQQ